MSLTISRQHSRAADPDAADAPDEQKQVAFVVDDDPAALALMCDIAEDAGWACRGFTRLRDLERGMDREPPGILILDDDLPDGSGGDLARELQQDPALARLPIVVCTAAHPARRAEITSWAPVVSKPFSIDELEYFLDRARRRGDPQSRHRRAG